MNLYEACIVLDVWHVVKSRAEIWSMSSKDYTTALNRLRSNIKHKFKELVVKHHPDKGGDNDTYVKIQQAYDLLKVASVVDLVGALIIEQQANIKYYTDGSEACKKCSKWSELVGVCITPSCTGFKEHETIPSKIKVWGQRKHLQNSGVVTGRGY